MSDTPDDVAAAHRAAAVEHAESAGGYMSGAKSAAASNADFIVAAGPEGIALTALLAGVEALLSLAQRVAALDASLASMLGANTHLPGDPPASPGGAAPPPGSST